MLGTCRCERLHEQFAALPGIHQLEGWDEIRIAIYLGLP